MKNSPQGKAFSILLIQTNEFDAPAMPYNFWTFDGNLIFTTIAVMTSFPKFNYQETAIVFQIFNFPVKAKMSRRCRWPVLRK